MNRVLRNVVSIIVVLVAASSFAAAQQTELSGTWLLDSKKDPETTLVISESGPEIKITETQRQNGKTVTREQIYFADGRGETNSSSTGKSQLRSTSRRSGRKLIVKFSLAQTRSNNLSIANDRIDEWTISKDGKTLKHTSSMHTSPQPGDVSSSPSNGPTVLSSPLNWEETRVFKRVP
jgi:hypothetical protein